MALDRLDLQIADEKKISGFAESGEASPTTDAQSLNEWYLALGPTHT
jgi:hypothetical protein